MKGYTADQIDIERRFSLTSIAGKNNKFWNIALLKDGRIVVHFGPQGQEGTVKTYPIGHKNSGRTAMDRLIASKTSDKHENGAYTENLVLDTPVVEYGRSAVPAGRSSSLRSAAVADLAKGDSHLVSLVTYLADVNAHQIDVASGGQITYNTTTGLFSTTQGVITLDQLHQARLALDSIATFSAHKDFTHQDFFTAVNRYMSLIPQQGEKSDGEKTSQIRRMDFSRMFGAQGLLRQGSVLDSLEASNAAAVVAPKSAAAPAPKADRMFQVDLTLVENKDEWQNVREHYFHTRGSHPDSQHLDVKEVYRLRIGSMADAFLKQGMKIGGVWECNKCSCGLWHGTKPSNLLSMFKRGMVVPPASDPHVTARMFGDGLYFANVSTKAIGYAINRYGGYYSRGDRIFMLCADVALGRPYHPKATLKKIPAGYDSCWVRVEDGVKTWSGNKLLNPELIVYQAHQANPVYLVEFSDGGR